MSRPPVTLENYSSVYDFYGDRRPNRLTTWALYSALGAIFAPDVVFADGAKEKIQQTLDSNRTLVLVANHSKDIDPCEMASTLIRHPVFWPMIGNTFIPAKSPIFHDLIKSPAFLNAVLRRAVDGLYAVPVFRSKEYGRDNPLLQPASRNLLTVLINKLNNGEHMGIMGEGERNTVDPTKVQKLQSGVGLMVCRVTEVEQPALIAMGIDYSHAGKLGRSPTIYLGEPSQEYFTKPREVMNWLGDEMQASLDAAVAHTQGNR